MKPIPLLLLVCTTPLAGLAQSPDSALPPPKATELWEPVPAVVGAPAGRPPTDAIALFDGNGLAAWESVKNAGQPAPWHAEADGFRPVAGSGGIRTKAAFGDLQLHLEYRHSADIEGKGQRRGNSGLFFMGLYELQILDSYSNPTYVNGQSASIYKQHPPLVNVARPPGEWQTYDAVWIAPRFDADGRLLRPARLTVFHNGVLVHHAVPLRGPTVNRGLPAYGAHVDRLPLMLQDHQNDSRDPIMFRNIWVRELTALSPME